MNNAAKELLVAHGHWSPLLHMHCKKRLAIFPSPAGMSLTKLSLIRNNFIFPAQGEFGG
jgi:hypothetical protein